MARPRRGEVRSRVAEHRRRLGLTQDQVAEHLGITPEMVRRHERGSALPISLYRQSYARLFGVSEEIIWLPPSAGAQPVAASPRAQSLAPVASVDYGDAAHLESIHAHMSQLVQLDNRFGGTDLVRLSSRFFRGLHSLVGAGRYPASLERDYQRATGELAEIVGWLAYDAQDHDLVRRMNQEALFYTRLSGDRHIELLTLQNASMHAGTLGRVAEARSIAESVLEGGPTLSPRVRALFLTRRARAMAQGGDDRAIATFGEVRSLFHAGVDDSDPPWAWWIDEREIAWHEAMAQWDLGASSAALEYFERSVAATAPAETRSQYLHKAYLLKAEVRMRSWSEATETLRQLGPLASEVASTRTSDLLRSVLSEAASSDARSPTTFLDQSAQLRATLDAAELG